MSKEQDFRYMRIKHFKLRKNPWFISIGSGVILILLKSIFRIGWDTVLNAILDIYHLAVFEISLPLSLIALLLILATISLYRKCFHYFSSKKDHEVTEGKMKSGLVKDKKGLHWRYTFSNSLPLIFGPFCPDCDLDLMTSTRHIRGGLPYEYYYCEDCKKEIAVYSIEDIGIIRRQLEREARQEILKQE